MKDFHNRLPSAGFLYLFYAYYFEIDTHRFHFLTNYETGFQLINMQYAVFVEQDPSQLSLFSFLGIYIFFP